MNDGFVLSVDIGGALVSGVLMRESELRPLHVLFALFYRNECFPCVLLSSLVRCVLTPLSSSSIESLNEAVIPVCANILYTISQQQLLLAQFRIRDAQHELLLFGALGRGQVRRQEHLESLGHLVRHNIFDVLEGLLRCLEGLERRQFHHLAEPLQIWDRLLDRLQLTTDLVEILLLKQTITTRRLIKQI